MPDFVFVPLAGASFFVDAVVVLAAFVTLARLLAVVPVAVVLGCGTWKKCGVLERSVRMGCVLILNLFIVCHLKKKRVRKEGM